MGLFNQLGGLLQQYVGGQTAAPEPERDLEHVAGNAPPEVLAQGLSHAFRSDQTPPFASMVSQLFSNSNPQQRAGLLSTLLSAAGPALGGLSGAGLGGLLRPGGSVTPEQAANVSPAVVEQMAAHSEQHDPSIVDRVSQYYSQHPQVVTTLGKVAATVALAGIANHLIGGNR